MALDFVAGRHERKGSFADFFASASPRAANLKLNSLPGTLASPLKLADRGDHGRPLLVLFEQGSCIACDELHSDTLSRSELAYALTNLDVAQVDLRSTDPLQTPDGRQLGARDWARELGIQYAPSLVFFDRQGQRVFRTEAYLRLSTCMERSITWYPVPIAGNLRFNASCSTGQRCWRSAGSR